MNTYSSLAELLSNPCRSLSAVPSPALRGAGANSQATGPEDAGIRNPGLFESSLGLPGSRVGNLEPCWGAIFPTWSQDTRQVGLYSLGLEKIVGVWSSLGKRTSEFGVQASASGALSFRVYRAYVRVYRF